MNIENYLHAEAVKVVSALYGSVDPALVQIQKTRKEFEGDYTLVVFPLLKASRKSPEATAEELGRKFVDSVAEIVAFNVIKGFLNLSLSEAFWAERFREIAAKRHRYGYGKRTNRTVMVEYSSPNTNKPLHLGHVRNNLLGYSVATILGANGNKVIKANLINDRGIHICKSMLAWQKWGGGETPESSGLKGDHLAGKYYVEFDKHYKAEIKELMATGMTEEDAKQNAPSIKEAQEMLRRWEAKDPATMELWKKMNGWVYDGFDVTYKSMGVDFDKVYYESETYLLGKDIVDQGLAKGVFYRRDDGSVWIDLTADGLDEKLLLRADGTSVYMTQDLGTAYRRFTEDNLDELIYVVGNEQNYHFQVLKLVLKKLGYEWADNIYHLSYGMVELPEGKMKSREGTVVDADDLIEGMIDTAREMSEEMGKLGNLGTRKRYEIPRIIGMGALKYFILKVDPRKTMLFDPKESIDFNGNTGPFIQYTFARINNIVKKAGRKKISYAPGDINAPFSRAEIEIVKFLADYPAVVSAAGSNYSPALIAQYVYDLAKLFNGYYHDHSILREKNVEIRDMRLKLSNQVKNVIRSGMKLLGIEMPDKM